MLFILLLYLDAACAPPPHQERCAGECWHVGYMPVAWGECRPYDEQACTLQEY